MLRKYKHGFGRTLKILVKRELSYATFQTQPFYINGNIKKTQYHKHFSLRALISASVIDHKVRFGGVLKPFSLRELTCGRDGQ